jgi:hypothetical protein
VKAGVDLGDGYSCLFSSTHGGRRRGRVMLFTRGMDLSNHLISATHRVEEGGQLWRHSGEVSLGGECLTHSQPDTALIPTTKA